MKILPVGAELFYAVRRADGRTEVQIDMTELVVTFRNFANTHAGEMISP